jgi:hypothetical protein
MSESRCDGSGQAAWVASYQADTSTRLGADAMNALPLVDASGHRK